MTTLNKLTCSTSKGKQRVVDYLTVRNVHECSKDRKPVYRDKRGVLPTSTYEYITTNWSAIKRLQQNASTANQPPVDNAVLDAVDDTIPTNISSDVSDQHHTIVGTSQMVPMTSDATIDISLPPHIEQDNVCTNGKQSCNTNDDDTTTPTSSQNHTHNTEAPKPAQSMTDDDIINKYKDQMFDLSNAALRENMILDMKKVFLMVDDPDVCYVVTSRKGASILESVKSLRKQVTNIIAHSNDGGKVAMRALLNDMTEHKPIGCFVNNCPPNVINKWLGYNINPVINTDGSECMWIVNHIKNIICGSDNGLFLWLMKWIGMTMNAEKTGVVVTLCSTRQGTGKNLFTDLLRRALNSKHTLSLDWDMMSKASHSELEYKVLTVIDELSSTDNKYNHKRQFDTVKRLITKTTGYEVLGKHKIEIVDTNNYIYTTNHVDSLFIEDADRRYAIFDCDNAEFATRPPESQAAYATEGYNQSDHAIAHFIGYAVYIRQTHPEINVRQPPVTAIKHMFKQHCDPNAAIDIFVKGFRSNSASIDAISLYKLYVKHTKDNRPQKTITTLLLKRGVIVRTNRHIEIERDHHMMRSRVYDINPDYWSERLNNASK